MEFRLSFIALILATLSPLCVTLPEITVTPSLRLTAGQNLTIICHETVSGTVNTLTKLGLYKEVSGGNFQPVVDYIVNPLTQKYNPVWGNTAGDLQTRLNITEDFTDPLLKSGTLNFVLYDVKCGDAAAFSCQSLSLQGELKSPSKNISIIGATELTNLTGPIDCDPFNSLADKDTCDNCFNFDDPDNGVKPKYAAINVQLMLTCTANVESSLTRAFRWYKTTANDPQQPIIENITYSSDPQIPGSCTYVGRSTLSYYPNSNDKELRISCQAGSTLQSKSKEQSICVQGLTYSPTGPMPGGQDPQSAGLGGGPIAGIVIGVIAVIVLVVVLVYFLWYRRRDDGESYSTREADGRTAPPPVSKKPEMHENSMYDTTGDNRNNHAPQSGPESEPLHYAELDLVRGGRPLDSDNEPTINRVRRTGQPTPYAEIQLPVHNTNSQQV